MANDLATLLHEATGEGECIWDTDWDRVKAMGQIEALRPGQWPLVCCCGKTTNSEGIYGATNE